MRPGRGGKRGGILGWGRGTAWKWRWKWKGKGRCLEGGSNLHLMRVVGSLSRHHPHRLAQAQRAMSVSSDLDPYPVDSKSHMPVQSPWAVCSGWPRSPPIEETTKAMSHRRSPSWSAARAVHQVYPSQSALESVRPRSALQARRPSPAWEGRY